MILKKSHACFFLILILFLLLLTAVSASDVSTDNTQTHKEISTKKVDTQKIVSKINTIKKETNKNKKSNVATQNISKDKNQNKTVVNKNITKKTNTTNSVKSLEPPSSDGYTVYQIGSVEDFVRKGTKAYYNLTSDIVFTKRYQGTDQDGMSFLFNAGDDVIINGNGHTVSYLGTRQNTFIEATGTNSKLTIFNLTMENFTNSAIHIKGPGKINITNCSFINNTNPTKGEEYGGGGIRIDHTTYNDNTYVIVTKSNFINNSASRGGAIFSNDPLNINITSCYFEGNSAKNGTGVEARGGGGALYFEDGPTLQIAECEFEHNYIIQTNGQTNENNIVCTDTTGAATIMNGYNNKVNGVYINETNSAEYGIISNENGGFQSRVYQYNLKSSVELENPSRTAINDTVRIIFKITESGHNTEMDGITFHVRIDNPNGTHENFDLTTDIEGYAYHDFSSEVNGTLLVTVQTDDLYGYVLNDNIPTLEKIYNGNISTNEFTIYKLNTTTTVNSTSFTSDSHQYRNFKVTVKDANNALVTSGVVNLKLGDTIVDTANVNNGIAEFEYEFILAGTQTVTFEYAGDESHYNTSKTSITANINAIVPTITVVANDVYVDAPADVRISLTHGDNIPLAFQNVTVIIDSHEENVTTDANGEAIFTNFTWSNKGNKLVTVKYLGNDSDGLAPANDVQDEYIVDKYSSVMTLFYKWENGVGTITVTLKGIENDEDITSQIKPHISIRGDNNNLVDEEVLVENGVATITVNQPLMNPRVEQAQWTGDYKYYGTSATTMDVDANYPSKITIITPNNINVGDEFDIRIELTNQDESIPIGDEIVYIYINGELVSNRETNTNGHVNLAYTATDNSQIVIYAKFEGNGVFNPSENTLTIPSSNISLIPTNMIINVPNEVKVNEEFSFNIKLADNKNSINKNGEIETISVKVNGNDISVTYDSLHDVYVGKYTPLNNQNIIITANYAGSNVYTSSSDENTDLTSDKIRRLNSNIKITAENSYYVGDTATIKFNLTDDNGDPLNGVINLTINGVSEENVAINGIITREFTSLVAIDDVLVTAKFSGDNVYSGDEDSITFDVSKIPTYTFVEVLNTTTGNLTLNVTVKDIHDNIIDEGDIELSINDYIQYHNIQSGSEYSVIKIDILILPSTNKIPMEVIYQGTNKYASSIGINSSDLSQIFDGFKVDYQIANLNLQANSSVYVGETVNITGLLIDGFNEILTYKTIRIQLIDEYGNSVTLPNNGEVRTGADGVFTYLWENSVYGKYTVKATFDGNSEINTTTETAEVTVKLIPTNTKVGIVNDTVGNVTISVNVTDARENHDEAVTTGKLIIHYGDNVKEVIVNSIESIIPIPITSTDTVTMSVLYVDDSNVYDTSTDNDFTSINAQCDQARLELTVSQNNILTEQISVTGKLLNGMNNGFEGTIYFTFNQTAYTKSPVTTNNDGTFSFMMDAVSLGNITITASFDTVDKVITGTSNTTSFNVSKIPTQTNMRFVSEVGDVVTFGVNVKNNTGDLIGTGPIDIYVENVFIKSIDLDDYQYETLEDDNYVYIQLTESEIEDKGLSEIFKVSVVYQGTDAYNQSSDTYSTNERSEALIKLELSKSTVYVNESTILTITLTDTDGNPIKGQVNVIIKDRTYNRVISVIDGTASTTISYSNSTIGNYEITANLLQSVLYKATTNSTNLEIIRIPTKTLVSVENNTWNKTKIKVEVINSLTNELINYGDVDVYINNRNQTDNEYALTGQPLIIDIQTLYSGRFDVNIKYLQNEYYESSEGINKSTASNPNPEKFDEIIIVSQKSKLSLTVNDSIYVDDTLVINGTLYNVDTEEYLSNQLIRFSINGIEVGSNITDSEGKFTYYYNDNNVNGTFTLTAEFVSITNIDGDSSSEEYVVEKIDTQTIIQVLNSTVGNATVSVNVKDLIHNTAITAGKLNVTINGESTIENVTGEETIFKLNIDEAGTYSISVKFIEDYKYKSSKALDYDTLNNPDGPKTLDEIEVENQTATLTVNTDKDTYKVGDLVTITGTLKDGLNKTIDGQVIITVDNIIQPTQTVTNGQYLFTYMANRNGTINISVKYEGNEVVDPITKNTTFNVEKIGTTTIVDTVSLLAGNVTISVNITGDDSKVVTDGQIKILIPELNKEIIENVNDTGDLTIIKLDDIQTSGDYSISVEYLGNGTYKESVGINEDGSVFDKITTLEQTAKLSISTDLTTAYVFTKIHVTGKLLDAMGKVIPGNNYVTLTFNGQDTTSPILVENDGTFSYERNTYLTGNVVVEVTYAGIPDKINETVNHTSYTINKLPTQTNVTIKNNTYGNASIDVVVTDTVNNRIVTEGWIYLTFMGSLEKIPINSETTHIDLNAVDANRYSINVFYNGTDYYLESDGVENGTGNVLDHINIVAQNSTITFSNNKTLRVGEKVEINGTVFDGMNNPIKAGEEIIITITGSRGSVHRSVFTQEGGKFYYNESTSYEGDFTVTVEYAGNSTISRSENTSTFRVNKINSITSIAVLNKTVGNITIQVNVTTDRMIPITSGSLKVYINDNIEKSFDIAGATTKIKLDDINSIQNVKVVVVYEGNDTYTASTGKDTATGEEFIEFTSEAKTSNITINVPSTPIIVNDEIVISGSLIDSLGYYIANVPLRFVFEDGVNEAEEVTGYTTDSNGRYSITRTTHLTGEVNVTVYYDGSADNTITGTHNKSTYLINKKESETHVTIVSYEDGNITYEVYFTDKKTHEIIKEGKFGLIVNRTQASRVEFDLSTPVTDYGDEFKYNMTVTDEGKAYVKIDDVFFNLDGLSTYAYVTFRGNDVYEGSIGFTGEMPFKDNLIVNVTVNQSYTKVNEPVTIHIELVNELGKKQNGLVNITIGDVTFYDKLVTNIDGYTFEYSNSTGGLYKILVEYLGTGAWNPENGTAQFTIGKLPTQTLVSVDSNIIGNLGINVVVNDTYNDEIVKNGKIRVTYAGQSNDVDVDSSGLTYIPIDFENPGSLVMLTVEFLEDDSYESSIGVNSSNTTQRFTEIIVVRQTAHITVNTDKNTYLIGEKIVVSGQLTNPLGSVDSKEIIISVGSTRNITTTNEQGFFIIEFEDGLKYKGNGTFEITAEFAGNETVSRTTNKTQYTVNKIPTSTFVTFRNNTAGNVTINVTVYSGKDNSLVTTGYVYVYNQTGDRIALINMENGGVQTLYSLRNSGTYEISVLYDENDEFLSSEGYDKDTNEKITSIEVIDQIPTITVTATPGVLTIGENVTINGTVKTSIDNIISGENLVKIEIGGETHYANLTNGKYSRTLVTTILGENTITVTFIGSPNIASNTNHTSIFVNKIPTKTIVDIANSTVGNVSLNVKVVNNTNESVTTGQLKVTVDGTPLDLIDVTSEITNVKLNINEIKDVIIQVEYIENSIYAGSIGIDNATIGTDDEQEFSGFSTTKQSSVIYVTVNKTNVIINEKVNITGTLVDDRGENIDGIKIVSIKINEEVYEVDVINGEFSLEYTPSVTGNITITSEYGGNGTINSSIANTTLLVDKIATTTNVSIINNTVGNFTIYVVVKDINNQIVKSGILSIYLNGQTTQVEVNSTGTTRIPIPLTYARPNVPFTVTYLENDVYKASNGFRNNTGEPLTNITVRGQNPIIEVSADSPRNVSQVVVINGTLYNGLHQPLGEHELTITVRGTTFKPITTADGKFRVEYIPEIAGEYTAEVTYNGDGNIYGGSQTVDFIVNQVETETKVELLNNTVGNVTILVKVTGKDNTNVVNGKFNVTINGDNKTYIITGENTIAKLDIDTVDTFTVTVTYLGDNKYLESIGKNDDETVFNTITSVKQNSTISIEVDPEDIRVEKDVTISGILKDGLGKVMPNTALELIFNDGINPPETEHIYTDANGRYSFTRNTHLTGTVNVTVKYAGNDQTILPTENSTLYTVNKIPTETHLTVLNYTRGNVTLRIVVMDSLNGHEITSGLFNLTVNGVKYGENYNLEDYLVNGKIIFKIPDEALTEEYDTAVITYLGNEKYLNSSDTASGNLIKLPTKINITLDENPYIHESFNIQIKLLSDNQAISGTIYYKIGDNEEIEQFITADGFTLTYSDDVAGLKNISVRFVANKTHAASNNTAYFTVTKLPTQTIVTIVNDTVGNARINVTVKDTFHNVIIHQGYVEVTVDDDEFTVQVTDDVISIPLDVTKKDTSLYVKYLENDEYQSSIGEDSDGNTVEVIKVKSQVPIMTISNSGDTTVGQVVTIEGYLHDALNNPISGKPIIVTLSDGISLRNNTESDGHYIVHYVSQLNGTFTATARYSGNTSIDAMEVSTTFKVNKINTTTVVSLLNNTLGNVTIAVNVTDIDNNAIINGKLNITVGTDTKLVDIAGAESVIKLNISTVDNVDVRVVYIGDEKYLESVGITNDSAGTDNPVEFGGIDVDKMNVNVIVNVDYDNVDVGNIVVVDIRLLDDMNNPLTADLDVTFNGEDLRTLHVNNGRIIFDRTTHIAGDVTILAVFNENTTAKRATGSAIYHVNKIDTNTTVSVSNNTVGNVHILVEVKDKYGNRITSGKINVTIGDGEVEQHDITGFSTDILLDIDTTDHVDVKVVYAGNDTYKSSVGMTKESIIAGQPEEFGSITADKQNATLTIYVNPDNAYVGENVTIIGTLKDGLGEGLNTFINLTFNGEETVTYEVINGNIIYNRTTHFTGPITVKAIYEGSENINPLNATATYTINKIPTVTIVKVLNKTSGNVSIDVRVMDNVPGEEHTTLTSGVLEIKLPNKTFTVEINSENTTIPLDLTAIKDTPITVKFLSNDKYESSIGVTSESYEEDPENPEVFEEISVEQTFAVLTLNKSTDKTYVGDKIIINGTLLDSNEQALSNIRLIVDINEDSFNVRTNSQGIYSLEYTPDYNDTFTVTVTYLGNKTASEIIKTTSFKADKYSTITIVKIENTTARNVTLNVTVKDNLDRIVTTGVVNITDDEGNLIETSPITGQYNIIKLNIVEDGQYTINVNYLENSRYMASQGLDYDSYTQHTEDPENAETVNEITVNKQTATLTLNTSLPEVYVGKNITIYGTLIDGMGNAINSIVNITIDSDKYENIAVNDGKYTLNNVTVKAGTITVKVDYAGNSSIDPISMETTFEVNLKPIELNTKILNNTIGNTTINVTIVDLVDDEKLNTSVIVTLPNGEEVPGEIINGSIILPIDVPYPGGEIKVTLPEDGEHEGKTITIPIDIEYRETNLTVDITNTTQGNTTLNITLKDSTTGNPITGEVNVTLPNGTNIPVHVDEGNIILPIDVPVGEGTITVSYPGDGTNDEVKVELPINVLPRDSQLNAEISNNTAGNTTVKVNVTDPVTGKPITSGYVNVTVDGVVVGRTQVDSDGTATIITNLNKTGKYTLVANFEGNENYSSSYKSIGSVDVTGRQSNMTATIKNQTKGNTTVDVKLFDPVTNEPITGKIIITLPDGTKINADVNNGNAKVPVDLPLGKSTVKVTYPGDDSYSSTEVEIPVNVKGLDTNITAKVTNNTQGNTKINVTITDKDSGKPLNGTVIVTLPDGTNITAKAVNGSVTVPVDLPVPGGNIIITYPSDGKHDENKITVPVKVNPRDTNIETTVTNDTVGNNTIKVKVTDPVTGKPITSGYVNVTVNGKNIGTAKVQADGTAQISTSIDKVGQYKIVATFAGNENYSSVSNNINAKIDKRESEVKVIVNNETVGNTTLTVTLKDNNTKKSMPGKVSVKLPNNKVVSVTLDKSGTKTIPVDIPAGKGTVTATYNGDSSYKSAKSSGKYKVDKVGVKVSVNAVEGIIGEKVTLSAKVVDVNGEKVTGGNLVFKINGKTLRVDGRVDSNKDPLKIKVVKGVAKYKLTIDPYLCHGINLTASYSGSYKHAAGNSRSADVNIAERTATIKVTTNKKVFKQNSKIKITVNLKDTTKNSKDKTLINKGYVELKINGKTMKDKSGKTLKLKVVNNKAKYIYTIPKGTSGIFSNKLTKDYVITAHYVNKVFADRIRNATYYTVLRSDIKIKVHNATMKNKVLNVKASIVDKQGNIVIGINKVCLKLDGHTYKRNGKTVLFKVKNGKIDISKVKTKVNKIKKLTIVTGDRQAYYAGSQTTTKVKVLK